MSDSRASKRCVTLHECNAAKIPTPNPAGKLPAIADTPLCDSLLSERTFRARRSLYVSFKFACRILHVGMIMSDSCFRSLLVHESSTTIAATATNESPNGEKSRRCARPLSLSRSRRHRAAVDFELNPRVRRVQLVFSNSPWARTSH